MLSPLRRLAVSAALALALPLALTACSGAASEVSLESTTTLPGTGGADLEEALAGSGAQLATLFDAMNLSGYDGVSDAEAVTVFAPSDTGFTSLDADLLSEVMADPDRLGEVLANHVVAETLMADDLPTSVSAESGLTLSFAESDGVATVNGIPIVQTDLTIENGVVHIIDGVLLGDEAE